MAFTPVSDRPTGTFTVITTEDDGLGSFREALINANDFLAAGNNVINFDIAGTNVHIVSLCHHCQ